MKWENGLSVQEVLEELKQKDPSLQLKIGLGNPMSYRGYYECLAFGPHENVTVQTMMEIITKCIGDTFQGYKGGDYTMDTDTETYFVASGEHWLFRDENVVKGGTQ